MTNPTNEHLADQTPVIQVTIAASPDAVWHALRTREALHEWHGWQGDDLDDEIDLIYFREAIETDPGRSITLGGGDRVEISPDGESTRVRLTRAPSADEPDRASFYGEITEGWVTFLHQLKFALEHHPGETRRTLFYSGHGDPPDADALIAGEPWFRTDHQRGTRVPDWGGGLLITARNLSKQTAMAVLTTYRLDDQAANTLDAAGRAWWTRRHPPQDTEPS